jgi:hypothetical protein
MHHGEADLLEWYMGTTRADGLWSGRRRAIWVHKSLEAEWQDDCRGHQGANRTHQDKHVVGRVESFGQAFVFRAIKVNDRKGPGPGHFAADGKNPSERMIERDRRICGTPELLSEFWRGLDAPDYRPETIRQLSEKADVL